MQKLIFLCVATGILLFSIIVVNISPLGYLGSYNWTFAACSSISDQIKIYEKNFKGSKDDKDKLLKPYRKDRDRCNRRKAMIGLYYTAYNLDIVSAGICALLGLLVYLKVGDIEKITGLIGLGCGFVGFVLTLVFVIESGLIFNDIDGENKPRMDSDGGVLKWDDTKKTYVCIYYDSKNEDAVLRRYSDWGNKYLSYRKDVSFAEEEKNYKYQQTNGCIQKSFSLFSYNIPSNINNGGNSNYGNDLNDYCKAISDGNFKVEPKRKYRDTSSMEEKGECDKLYYVDSDDFLKKIIYDRWLTTIIFSCFIFLLNIGLAIFGFLLFNGSGKTNL